MMMMKIFLMLFKKMINFNQLNKYQNLTLNRKLQLHATFTFF